MQGGGYWQGQITHFDFKDRFNFKLHVLGTQMTLRAGVSCLHLQDVLIETWAGAQLKAGTEEEQNRTFVLPTPGGQSPQIKHRML